MCFQFRCPGVSLLSRSGTCRKIAFRSSLIIYNTILTGIRRVDPNAKQCYLAYCDTLSVPEKVKPLDGIFLEYAPIDRDTKIPLEDRTCEINQRYHKEINALIDFFGTKDAQALEYWLDNSLFSGWKKPPKPLTICTDTIQQDIAFYRKTGFEGITTFGCYLSDDYIELYGTPPIADYGKCFS